MVEARSAFSIADVIERLRVDMQNASSSDYFALARELYALLTEEGRHDEALRLAEEVIAQDPDDVLFASWRATLCQECLGDLQKASESIDVALARALRTREWLRYALGVKARVLLALGRGEDIAPVLEQIMSLKLDRDIADISRERDFVDAAPPGRISADIVACYDRFCPKPADGSPLELLEFEPPKFNADGEEIPFARDGHGAIIVSTDGATLSLFELDRMILSVFRGGNWRKTAAVVSRVTRECEDRRMAVSFGEVFERVLAMVDSGSLEAAGDLSLWRYSELRPSQAE